MLQKVQNNSDESFEGHGTDGDAFEDYEAARMVLTLPAKLS